MSNETEMRAILQELHDKFGMRVYGTSSYIKKDMRDRIAAALVMPTQAPAATEAPSKPFAYYIHIAAEQRGEFVHDLDEALDDLTNCECKITELFDRATPAPASEWLKCEGCGRDMRGHDRMGHCLPAVGASVQPVLASLSDEQIDAVRCGAQVPQSTDSEELRWTKAHARTFARAVLALASSTPSKGGQTS